MMKQEMLEKKIIEDIQNYSSPEPDKNFEERLKQQFLQKVQQVKRKRKFFRTVSWSGAVAASVSDRRIFVPIRLPPLWQSFCRR